jgi:hypothetical protein
VTTIDLGKIRARVDFNIAEFDRAIFQMGARVHWSRALECPCRLNDQTRQPDPTCDACDGTGFLYVHPSEAQRLVQYTCTPPFEDTADAAATQVLVQSVTKDPQIFEKFGEWVFGTVRCTPFSFARLDFRDRLRLVDSVTSYRQVFYVPESRTILVGSRAPENKLKYPVVNLREAYKLAGSTKVNLAAKTAVNANGSLTFTDPTDPVNGSLVSISYDYHPNLIVLDHVYAWRDTLKILKTKEPVGAHAVMPHHAMARLDFLVSP